MLSAMRFPKGAMLALAGALSLSCAPVPMAYGQNLDALFVPITEGDGPEEHVVSFTISPNAKQYRLTDDALSALGNALVMKNMKAESDAAAAAGRQLFGDKLGIESAVGTLAQHALWLDEVAPVNDAFAIVGLAVGIAQVARDAAAGRDDAALTGGIKTWMSFAISKWGWGPVQIGGIALFVVDVTLREWQAAVLDAATEAWSCPYRAWYRAHPRPLSEWKVELWRLYLAAEGKSEKPYGDYVDGVLNEWVSRAFEDDMLASYGDCKTPAMGLGHAVVQENLMAEHKALLEVALAKKVMPEIADRAFVRNLEAEKWRASAHLMPRLNKKLKLEVTAYGYSKGTQVIMPLPAGGAWTWTFSEDGMFSTEITKLAIIKAGYPERIAISTGDQSEERGLAISDGRLVAIFGEPQSVIVARYELSEEAGTCELKKIMSDGKYTSQTVEASAHAPQIVDFAPLANGSWVFGQYDPATGWRVASPAITKGTDIVLGEPFLDAIDGFEGCQMNMLSDDRLAESECTITRYESKAGGGGTTLERACEAEAELELAGFFSSAITGEMTYYPIEGQEGRILVNILKQSLAKGVVSGVPQSFPGSPISGGN